MSDTTLNRFVASGTHAQRLAFTPTPATPASGPSPLCIWYETDTGLTYASANGGAWAAVSGGVSAASGTAPGMDGADGEDGMPIPGPAGAAGAGAASATPVVVQTATAISNGVSVTMGAAPTAGNLLIAFVTHWTSNVTAATGWVQVLSANGTDDGLFIAYKYCGGGESTTQTPLSSSTSNNICAYEISGAAVGTVGQIVSKAEASLAVQTLVFGVGKANSLIIGMNCTTGSNSVPTITGVTGGTNITGTTASGSPRSLTPFSAAPSVGTTTATATYGGAVNQYMLGMLLGPA